MDALKVQELGISIGILYIADYDPTAVIPALLDDGSNVDDVYTAIKTEYPTLTQLASIKDLQISVNANDNVNTLLVDDRQAQIYGSVKPSGKVSATWFQTKNATVLGKLWGVTPVSITETLIQYDLVGIKQKAREMKEVFVAIIGERSDGKIEEYYFTRAYISGEAMVDFLKSDGSVPAGSGIEMTLVDGGDVIIKLPKIV